LLLVTAMLGAGGMAHASRIVVAHDINTLASGYATSEEQAFAVNLATFLTTDSGTNTLLMFDSNPGDPTRDFASSVITALTDAGFSVTVTDDYTTPFAGFGAVFLAMDWPIVGFIDNNALLTYAASGGGVYLAGGVGSDAIGEAAGWSPFLTAYGLGFATTYNEINGSVPVSGAHPIFAGVGALQAGSGQSIIDLGTNPSAQIVLTFDDQNMYAVATDIVPTDLLPGRITAIKSGMLAKFVAKPVMGETFNLPVANPVTAGGSLRVFDMSTTAGDNTYALPSGGTPPLGWKGLGSPAGSKGYKYKGAGTVGDPCKVVLVKPKVIKAVCRGSDVTLMPPFAGDVGIILSLGATDRYCAQFGGDEVKNDATLTKRKNAPAPTACPEIGSPGGAFIDPPADTM
jgi:hypothetical protein